MSRDRETIMTEIRSIVTTEKRGLDSHVSDGDEMHLVLSTEEGDEELVVSILNDLDGIVEFLSMSQSQFRPVLELIEEDSFVDSKKEEILPIYLASDH